MSNKLLLSALLMVLASPVRAGIIGGGSTLNIYLTTGTLNANSITTAGILTDTITVNGGEDVFGLLSALGANGIKVTYGIVSGTSTATTYTATTGIASGTMTVTGKSEFIGLITQDLRIGSGVHVATATMTGYFKCPLWTLAQIKSATPAAADLGGCVTVIDAATPYTTCTSTGSTIQGFMRADDYTKGCN